MAETRQLTLNQLGIRRKGVVTKVLHGPWYQRLLDMGLVPDTPVEVLLRAPMSGPVAYRVRGFCIALRKSEAAQIVVEEVR
ncbi:MAG: ferrous iron transport protein A [Candidatus Desulforudis sp.]|nr:ferrous iron transport protein A [Desulforudis sp.]